MKKIIAALLVFGLAFSPIGEYVFQQQNHVEVSAKSYKSGKRSYNTSTSSGSSFFNKSSEQQKSPSSTINRSTTKRSGGIMKGLFIGGLAGLLFGSLLGNLGILGSILGLFVNVMAIVVLIGIVRKIYSSIKKRRNGQNLWQR